MNKICIYYRYNDKILMLSPRHDELKRVTDHLQSYLEVQVSDRTKIFLSFTLDGKKSTVKMSNVPLIKTSKYYRDISKQIHVSPPLLYLSRAQILVLPLRISQPQKHPIKGKSINALGKLFLSQHRLCYLLSSSLYAPTLNEVMEGL